MKDMKNIEEFRKKTEEGIRILKETAERVAQRVEKEAKIGKKYLDIRRLKKEAERIYGEIGMYIYEEISSKKVINPEDPFLLEKFALIERIKKEIRELESEISALRLSTIEKEG